MATATLPLSNRVDANLKREFDATANELGLSPTSALTVLMKRFVDEGGFPFEVRRRVPSRDEYVQEMESRYDRMLAGHETEHDLLEA